MTSVLCWFWVMIWRLRKAYWPPAQSLGLVLWWSNFVVFFFYPELADLRSWLCVHISASSVSFLLSSFLIAQTLQCPLLSAAALTSKTSQCVTGFECLHHTLRHSIQSKGHRNKSCTEGGNMPVEKKRGLICSQLALYFITICLTFSAFLWQ